MPPATRIFFAIFLFFAQSAFAGDLRGTITDADGGQPLPGVNVYLKDTPFGAVTDSTGAFVIRAVPEGAYRLEIHFVGYRAVSLAVHIPRQGAVTQKAALAQTAIALEDIVVTPGRFSVLKQDPVIPQTLTREEIRSMPQFGDDIYRAIGRLPGVTGSDFSSRFSIRGGDYDQVLVTLDGMELHNPFHLKDVEGGGLSIVDTDVIGGIDMIAGGFPADYGNKQSAVMTMKSARPNPGRRFAAGLGLANARIFGEGGTDRLGWLVSARRGYVDLVLKLMHENENFRPVYYDAFGKLAFKQSDRNQFSLNVLWAHDNLNYRDKQTEDYEFFSRYGNTYTWLVWDATLNGHLHARTLPYISRLTTHRIGNTYLNPGYITLDGHIDDIRKAILYGLKSDWTFQPQQNHLLRFGFDIQHQTADYDYFSRKGFWDVVQDTTLHFFVRNFDTTRVAVAPTATALSAYVTDKWRIAGPLTADLGLRVDHHSQPRETQWSPRIAFALPIGDNTVLRAAWGRYAQSQNISDLPVQYDDTTFRPAERATHYIVGLEQRLPRQVAFRVEGYVKKLNHIRDRYEDVENEIELMPELYSNIQHLFPATGSIRGLEFYLKRDTGGRFNWWASYTLSKARETYSDSLNRFLNVAGRTYPQKRDQRHQIAIDVIYRPAPNWNISAAWQYHTGWPHTALHLIQTQTTPRSVYSVRYIDLYDERYPPYHRLDVKFNRQFTFASWRLTASVGVVNLYNRHNVRRYIYVFRNQTLTRTSENWFPRLPSFTLSADF